MAISWLSWGEQVHSILSQYQAEYPAILDIATSLSLNKLFGCDGKKKVGMRLTGGNDYVVQHPRMHRHAHPEYARDVARSRGAAADESAPDRLARCWQPSF